MANILAFLLMSLIWGLTWLPVKVITATVPPIFTGAIRFVVAGALFWLWAWLGRMPLRTSRPGRLALAVLLITAGCHAPMFWGVQHAPTGLAAVVNLSLMPVFTMLAGLVAREETIDGRRLAAIGLGVAGLVLLFWPRLGAVSAADRDVMAGLLAVVAGTLSYAAGAVASRPLLREMPTVAFSAWTLLGGVAMLPLSFALEGFEPRRFADIFTWPAVGCLAYLVLCGSLAAFTIYLRLVRDWGLFGASLYAFVSPIVAVLVGVLWLGERIGPFEAAGMAVMLLATAVALASRRTPPVQDAVARS
jgi:drug/metabolite transporter (DMT)-like permease